jgi:hypothetical protein
LKFKLDENLGRRGQEILTAAGHDVSGVAEQKIQSIGDDELNPALSNRRALPRYARFGIC